MADNDQHASTDLLEGTNSTDTSAPTGDDSKNLTLLTEENPIQNNPEKDKTANAAILKRQQQVSAWVSKGQDALKDLPKDKEWLRPYIEAEFKLKEKEPEIDKIIEEKFAKKEAQMEIDRHYNTLRATLRSVKPKPEVLEKIQARQDQLLSRGVPKNEALEVAMEAAGISMDPEEQDRLILRQRMALPLQGNQRVQDTDPRPDDPDFHKKVRDPKQRMRILMEHMRSSG